MDNIARKIREETRQRGRDRKLRENVNKEREGKSVNVRSADRHGVVSAILPWRMEFSRRFETIVSGK